MVKLKKKIYEYTEVIMKLFAFVSAGVVLFNLVLLSANVVMRYVFKSPIKGTAEIVAMMMAWVAYSGMAYTLLRGGHMQLEALTEKVHGKAKHIVNLVVYGLASVMFILFTRASFHIFMRSLEIKEKSVASVTVYVFIGKCGTFIGWTLLAIQAVLMAIYCIQGIAKPDVYEPIGTYSDVPDEEAVNALVKDKLAKDSEQQKGGDGK